MIATKDQMLGPLDHRPHQPPDPIMFLNQEAVKADSEQNIRFARQEGQQTGGESPTGNDQIVGPSQLQPCFPPTGPFANLDYTSRVEKVLQPGARDGFRSSRIAVSEYYH